MRINLLRENYIQNVFFKCVCPGAISPFIGFTPDNGIYGSEMGVVNLGITGKKTIKVTESFEIPVKASVISNPQTSNVYFVLGITL